MSHSSLYCLPQPSMAAYPPQYQQKQTQQHQQQQPRFGGHAWGKVAQQPPFSGAPPIPTGVSVNPQQWQAGYWQYNPAYNQNQNTHQQHALWIPSQRWNYPQQQQQSSASQQQQQQAAQQQQQQQQQANYNPYKRQPRPPSAEYLATKLVENPLGLFGMDEKKFVNFIHSSFNPIADQSLSLAPTMAKCRHPGYGSHETWTRMMKASPLNPNNPVAEAARIPTATVYLLPTVERTLTTLTPPKGRSLSPLSASFNQPSPSILSALRITIVAIACPLTTRRPRGQSEEHVLLTLLFPHTWRP